MGSIQCVEQFLERQEPQKLRPFLIAQTRLLELIATRAPLTVILEQLIAAIEDQIEGMLCSVLLVSDDQKHLRLGAAPSLSPRYSQAIDGGAIGPCAGSCGTAAFLKRQVIVTDIATDPLWAGWREPALEAGLRACWSTPILAADGQVLGTFAIYYRRTMKPTELHLTVIEVATYLAGVAIERDRLEREREQLTQKLRCESDLLKRCLEARDEFITLASHELRTPLAILRLKVETLREKLPAPESSDAVLRQVDRLEHLASDLVEYIQINGGHIPITLADGDLAAISADAVAQASPAFERAGRSLRFHSDGPVLGKWDKARIAQILDQLLSNALRYGLQQPVEVFVDCNEQNGRIRVRDSGIGIDKACQQAIFGRFERGVSWRHYGGLGLGLWICRRVVEALGGSIAVDSELGQGATFTIELPPRPTIVPILPTCPA